MSYYQHNYYYDVYRQQPSQLAIDIERAIYLKYNAINCYAELSQMAPNNITKANILAIRQDDIKHYEAFRQIYRILTGINLEVKPTQICAKTWDEGIEAAFLNEQLESRFYLKLADESTNQDVKNIFYRAAMEDMIHASWFLYYIYKK
jgi:rubrerythrin